MDSSSTWAQDVITCDLCDNPTQQFCNSCQVRLCGNCINKHVETLKSQTHDIVPFTDREERLVFPSCPSHPRQRCEGHCQQCGVLVCFKCLTGPHHGHTVMDMTDIVKHIKDEIMQEIRETESYISRFTLGQAKMDQKISKLIENFENLEREGEKLSKIWHEEVDDIFNTLKSTVKTMKDKRLKVLKSHESFLQNLRQKLALIMKENKEILKSNKVTDVTSHKSKLKDFRSIPSDIDVSMPGLNSNIVKGRELSIQLEEYKATLQQVSISNLTDEVSVLSVRKLMEKAKVVANIPCGKKTIRSLICVGTNEAWVNNEDKNLRYIDIYGFVEDKVAIKCETFPSDISVNKRGELIFSDVNTRTVNIVRHEGIDTLIILPKGWHPWGLCCTRSGEILVSMCTRDQSHYKIVRFQGQTAAQECDRDEDGKQIFKGGEKGVNVAENNNGDICAADMDAKTVIVVDKTGRVRFRYNGTPARRSNPFQPIHIVTDSLSQIIINDINNNCLHILDQNGQFLKCVDNCSLVSPHGLSVDDEERLWVGSYYTGDVKVIKYME
ncbi:uncharacterized protein LOC134248145 [Saccostrea cucullata]|uniref:uncharacterized protein LOC134248145 n=1 Tax=Saccostrea cuccullata TaxID=36930 RepID=UPI002ED2DA99